MPSQLKKIIIVLVLGLRLVIAESAEKSSHGKVLVFLGDSLTAGYGLDPAIAYPSLIQTKLNEKGLPYAVVNAGVSGNTTADGLSRLNWVLKRKVDILVIALGANDGLRGLPLQVIKKNLATLIDQARKKYPSLLILLAGIELPPNMGPDYRRAFEEIYPELAKKKKVYLIPFLLGGVGGNPKLNLPDRIHPNANGHQIMAETVWKALEPYLE